MIVVRTVPMYIDEIFIIIQLTKKNVQLNPRLVELSLQDVEPLEAARCPTHLQELTIFTSTMTETQTSGGE